MSKARKIMAWLLTGIMALGMCTTVSAAGFSITRQPEDAASAEGSTVVFEVAAEPSDNVTYQWQQGVLQKTEEDTEPVCSWTDIPGADKARYEHKVTAADLSGIGYRCKVSLDGETVYSETVVIREPGILPVLVSKDSTSITVQAVRGQEYTIYTGDVLPGDAQWKSGESSITFTELAPGTKYSIVSRAAASEGIPAGTTGEILVVMTEEAPEPQSEEAETETGEPGTQPEEAETETGEPGTEPVEPEIRPEVPKLVNRTDTILEVETVEGQEYRIDQKAWQESGRFEGLSPDTEYVIETRAAGDGEDTPVSEPLTVRTMKAGAGGRRAPQHKKHRLDGKELW